MVKYKKHKIMKGLLMVAVRSFVGAARLSIVLLSLFCTVYAFEEAVSPAAVLVYVDGKKSGEALAPGRHFDGAGSLGGGRVRFRRGSLLPRFFSPC